MEIELTTASLATGLAFISAFLRGFQNKNVAAGYKSWAFFTGYLMGILDAIAISIIASTGPILAVFYGLGMGTGYLCSIVVHKRLARGRERQRKQRKQAKLETKIERLVNDAITEKIVDKETH